MLVALLGKGKAIKSIIRLNILLNGAKIKHIYKTKDKISVYSSSNKSAIYYSKREQYGNNREFEEFNLVIKEYVKRDYFSYKYDRKRGGWESLNYLLDKGIIKDMEEYFNIVNSSHEELCFRSPNEVIEIIKNAGGHPFLAHPSAYVKGDNLSIKTLNEWKDSGICGIECYSPYLKSMEDADYYINFCNENNLMISVGSDCHGEFNDRILGIPKVDINKLRLDFIITV